MFKPFFPEAPCIIAPPPDPREGKPSASSMERVMACPGSFLLEKALDEPGNKKAADRGIKVHDVLHGVKPFTSLNHSDRICAERIMFQEAKLVEELGFEGAEQMRETRLKAQNVFGETCFTAQSDVVFSLGDQALVINYKTGFYGPTPIRENVQMLCESIVVALLGRAKIIWSALIHPNYELPDGAVAQHDLNTSENLLGVELPKMISASTLALQPDAPRIPSEKACRWCRGKKNKACPEWLRSGLK